MNAKDQKIYSDFGIRLKELRRKHNISQGDLAKALNLSQSALAQYEAGGRKISLSFIDAAATFFNMSYDELVYGGGVNADRELCKVIADNLRACRTDRKMTREEMSAEIGISADEIEHYERAETEPTIPVIIQFAKFFKVSLDSLVGLTVGTDGKSFTFVETDPQRRAGYQQWKDAMGDYSLNAEQIQELITFAQFLKYRDSENK